MVCYCKYKASQFTMEKYPKNGILCEELKLKSERYISFEKVNGEKPDFKHL